MTDFERWFDEALAEQPATLSPTGAARRDALRTALQGAVVRRRRTRRALRAGAAAALLAALAWFAWPATIRAPLVPAPPSDRLSIAHADFVVVCDDPGIVARCAAPASALAAETWVDDDALLDLLARAGRPTGLLRTGRRVVLTEDVVDPLGE